MKYVFYHAGCPVCLEAKSFVEESTSADVYDATEIVDLSKVKSRVAEAVTRGVKSVPALVAVGDGGLDTKVFHINHGADIDALARE